MTYTDENRPPVGTRVLIVCSGHYVSGRESTVLHPYDSASFGKRVEVQVDGHKHGRFSFRPEELTPVPEQKQLFT